MIGLKKWQLSTGTKTSKALSTGLAQDALNIMPAPVNQLEVSETEKRRGYSKLFGIAPPHCAYA